MKAGYKTPYWLKRGTVFDRIMTWKWTPSILTFIVVYLISGLL